MKKKQLFWHCPCGGHPITVLKCRKFGIKRPCLKEFVKYLWFR